MNSNDFWKCISSEIIQSNACDYFKKSTSKRFARIWWNRRLIIHSLFLWIQQNCCLQKMMRRFQTILKHYISEKSGFFSSQSFPQGLTLFLLCQDYLALTSVLKESIMQQRNEFCSISITWETNAFVTKTTKSSTKNVVWFHLCVQMMFRLWTTQ